MSVNVGPSNPSTGLVLDIDMYNTKKSWLGAPPTTNIMIYSVALANWTIAGGITSIVDNSAISPSGNMDASLVTANGTTNSYMVVTGSVAAGAYTRSVYAKAGTTPTLVFETYDNGAIVSTVTFNLSTGTYSGVAAGDTVTMIPYPNGWYRCIISRTFTAVGNVGTFYIGAYGLGSGTMYLWRPQLEAGAVATAPVETYGSSASRTATSLDSTKYNTPTITNTLTYENTGAFKYNGTSNQSLTVPFNADKFTFTKTLTIILWLKPTILDTTNRRNPFHQDYSGEGSITYESTIGYFNYFYGIDGNSTGTTYQTVGSSFAVAANETAMIAVTRSSSYITWSKNGVSDTPVAATYTAAVSGSSPIKIGAGYASSVGFGGYIYSVQLYNRTLSGDEILQVYNASRRRFLTNFVISGLVMLLDASDMNSYIGTGTTWNDLSGSANNVTISGGTFVQYINGGYFSLNGTASNKMTLSTTNFNKSGTQELTVSCWIKPSRNAGQYQDIVTNRSDTTFNWILYQHSTDGSIQLHGTNQNKSTYIPTIGEWINVTATVTSGSVSTLYINGVSQQVVSGYTYNSATPGLLCIGGYGTSGEPYQGLVANVAIYSRAITAAEVLQNFNAMRERYGY